MPSFGEPIRTTIHLRPQATLHRAHSKLRPVNGAVSTILHCPIHRTVIQQITLSLEQLTEEHFKVDDIEVSATWDGTMFWELVAL